MKSFLASSDPVIHLWDGRGRFWDLYEVGGRVSAIVALGVGLYYIINGFCYIVCRSRYLWYYWSEGISWFVRFEFSVYVSGFVVSYCFWKFDKASCYVVDSDNFIYLFSKLVGRNFKSFVLPVRILSIFLVVVSFVWYNIYIGFVGYTDVNKRIAVKLFSWFI